MKKKTDSSENNKNKKVSVITFKIRKIRNFIQLRKTLTS